MRVRVSDDPDEMTGRMQVEADGELDERRLVEAEASCRALAEQLAAALRSILGGIRIQDHEEAYFSALPECEEAARAALAAAKERGIG